MRKEQVWEIFWQEDKLEGREGGFKDDSQCDSQDAPKHSFIDQNIYWALNMYKALFYVWGTTWINIPRVQRHEGWWNINF